MYPRFNKTIPMLLRGQLVQLNFNISLRWMNHYSWVTELRACLDWLKTRDRSTKSFFKSLATKEVGEKIHGLKSMGVLNLNCYKHKFMWDFLKTLILYRETGKILRYILALGETFVLNVFKYWTIFLKAGIQY